MPLVSSSEVLWRASSGGYAVGAFNVNNAEMLQAIIGAAEDENSPVIVLISMGAIAYLGLELATEMVIGAARRAAVPVVLQLDHGSDFDINARCLRAGFTSLMYDGSALPIEENIRDTAAVARMAHAVGVPVEAELGRIAKVEEFASLLAADYDYSTKLPEAVQDGVRELMADPREAAGFVERTGCDSLAAAIGSVHGMRRAVQPLDISRLDAIRARTGVPIVVHGASGVIPTRRDAEQLGIRLEDHEGTLQDAIEHGVAKVNVGTELSAAFIKGIMTALEVGPGAKDMRKVLGPARQLIRERVRSYMRLFGCAGKGGAVERGAEADSESVDYVE